MPSPITTPGYRYATRRFAGDSVTVDFEFNFDGVDPGYISRDHVEVWIFDNATRVETQVNPESLIWMGPNQIRIPEAQPSTKTIIIRRNTPKEQPLLDFTDGAILNEGNLNMTSQQAVYVAAEMVDLFADLMDIFRGVNQDVIDSLAYAQQALDLAQQALDLAQQALDRANEAWDLANSKPDSFLELNDTPDTYGGNGGKVAIAKVDETGMDLVPVGEIPGLETFINEIIDGHGGGGGGGLPTTTPVLLYAADAAAENGMVLMAGANITLTDNGSGGLVVASTGGGGGGGTPGVDIFAVGNDSSLAGTDVNGAWMDPTGVSNLPEDGADGYKNSLFLGTGEMTGENQVKYGVRMDHAGVGPSVSIGFDFSDPVVPATGPIVGTGLYVDNHNIYIGKNVSPRLSDTSTGGGNGNIILEVNLSHYNDGLQSDSSFIVRPKISNAASYVPTGPLFLNYQFGEVDLGNMPGAYGFRQDVSARVDGDSSRIHFKAAGSDSVGLSGTGGIFCVGGNISFQDLSAADSCPDQIVTIDQARIMVFEGNMHLYVKPTEFGSEYSHLFKLSCVAKVVKTSSSRTVTILSQSVTPVYEDSSDTSLVDSSSVEFRVVGSELQLFVDKEDANAFSGEAFLSRDMFAVQVL